LPPAANPQGQEMITILGRRRHLFVALCLLSFALSTPAKAQVRPPDFDLTDGKIQAAKGHRQSVSTKEMSATLKFATEQTATIRYSVAHGGHPECSGGPGSIFNASRLGRRRVLCFFEGVVFGVQELSSAFLPSAAQKRLQLSLTNKTTSFPSPDLRLQPPICRQ
jgi:hypothetical protein